MAAANRTGGAAANRTGTVRRCGARVAAANRTGGPAPNFAQALIFLKKQILILLLMKEYNKYKI
ncbi:MAG: hypothetical protein EAZ70_09540 [Runella slithyformis]|nr:MAG: hypothetical protein EAY79_08245 [Runella slithyformis]TAF25895.1 MAG: hypothetical protein EAZ70_09540 [Runella slithyformis]TAF43921.1 MAG: hypothetical protein EAZ63_13060 [Runella slithyformis]TAF80777.1 MAG: hypothetical protein EAZ50_07965 [Runella slithyformis]